MKFCVNCMYYKRHLYLPVFLIILNVLCTNIHAAVLQTMI